MKCSVFTLLVILEINDSRLELPSGNLALEQDVHFAIRAMLELRKAEVSNDLVKNRSTTLDIPALSRKVLTRRIQYLGSEVDYRDLYDIIRSTTNAGA
jgi:hypothetical protein